MSKGELGRVEVLARVQSRQLKVVDAAQLMHLSYRQAKRLWKRYREEGAAGLKHRSAGRASNRAYEEKFRGKVLRLVREKYGGPVGERFGPTLAAEHLASEDGLKVDGETLRRWMLAEGLWSRERKRRRHLRRRERKEHFGEMVQMDGSFHGWVEERGPQGCLIDLVDDATSTTWAQLGEQETIWAVADGLRAWIERYGVPLALYVDWKNLYKRPATPKERLRGEEPITQFGRMCAKLGIELIAASSPQAKGRVERQHGTHQDRLVKKLRRQQITSHEQANVYLRNEYLTSALPVRRRGRKTTTVVRPARRNSTGFSGWKPNARSAMTGWCAIRTDSFSSSRRVGCMRQRRARCWCAKGGTAVWRSNIGAASCAGKRSHRPRAPLGRRPLRGSRSQSGRRRRRRLSISGYRQRITPGVRRLVEPHKRRQPVRPPSRHRHLWPGPPLRPKRSALRAPQGFAPRQAKDPGKNKEQNEKGPFLTR
jgi:transposase